MHRQTGTHDEEAAHMLREYKDKQAPQVGRAFEEGNSSVHYQIHLL